MYLRTFQEDPLFRTRSIFTGLALVSLAFGAVACGSDDDTADSTTTTTEATTTTKAASGSGGESEATIRADKMVQQELYDVGCHPGAVDGVFGPQTDAAILAFQKAAGIPADGEYGPETQTALNKAVKAGDAVCDAKSSTTTTAAQTTTTAGSGGPACTAAALLTGLPAEGETISSYVCAGGYAAGSLNDGTKFILQAQGNGWFAPSQDPCGTASAGLPPQILEDGCGS